MKFQMKFKYLYFLFVSAFAVSCTSIELPQNVQQTDSLPPIFPDYVGVTVPVNICPLDFDMEYSDYQIIDVNFKSENGQTLHTSSKGAICIDIDSWKSLLNNAAGKKINVTVSVKKGDKWLGYKPFNIFTDTSRIDYAVVYRKIAPGYETFDDIGIYERNLSDFNERNIVNSNQLQNTCMNCHTFNRCNPDNMILHVRGAKGGTFFKSPAGMDIFNTKTKQTRGNFQYCYYHPQGRYVVASQNKTRQVFRTGTGPRIDVMDEFSDVAVYDIQKNEILYAPWLRSSEFHDFPSFSADGKKIYFALADSITKMPEEYQTLKFNICSVDFDAQNGVVSSKVDTVINAAGMNKSATEARPSYDGKYLMYCMLNYGDFAIWHTAADLWLYNIATGENKPLTEANSDQSEAYHNWSSSSHWYVVASRRVNGLYSMLYFARIGEDGVSSKPFLLPQRDPKNFYNAELHSYNCPEFTIKPVDFGVHSAINQSDSEERKQVEMQSGK